MYLVKAEKCKYFIINKNILLLIFNNNYVETVGGYNSPIILKNCGILSFMSNFLLKINSAKYPIKCKSLVPNLGIFARTSRQRRSIF